MDTKAEIVKLLDGLAQTHRDRGRSMATVMAKLIARRTGGDMPKTSKEYMEDWDIVKRAAEHAGACQFANELRQLLLGGEEKN